jgi:hypothetical protein
VRTHERPVIGHQRPVTGTGRIRDGRAEHERTYRQQDRPLF